MNTSRPHLLVAEDDADTRAMLAMLLGDAGFRVTTAENGRVALELLQARGDDVDLLLVDVHMPEMSGLELLSALAADPVLRGVPALVLSATPVRGVRHLGKHMSIDHLLAEVRAALGDQRSAAE